MEAAIAWLVQTILAALKIDKLDSWIGEVGLADDIEKLKSEIRRVKMVVSTMKERGIGNEPLSESLTLLQDHLYEADDVIDELDYYRLNSRSKEDHADPLIFSFGALAVDDPQGVPAAEQVDDTSRSRGNAGMPLDDTSSNRGDKKRKKRSKAWENFNVTEEDEERAECKHCKTIIKCSTTGGTSGMLNHNKVCKKIPRANEQPPNPSSAGDATETATPIVIADTSSRKRRREDEESAQITVANTFIPWEKAELSNRIQKITSQLQNVREEVSELLKLHGSDSASSSNHHPSTTSDQLLRTSSLVPREVYGRVAEKISIRKLILEEKSDGVRVLPIVGIAGVGKTALAQFVYNDQEVESKFDHRIWVWVSRNFDEVRLTREMLDFVSQERHEGISSFAKLQEILKSRANSKRLLLIFDDVWDDMNGIQWNKLLAPLMSSHVNGNVILVTTRSMTVAQRLGTLEPVMLHALANDDFWLLFKSCAFGYENYDEHQSISIIGRQIAEKLRGNPLAAVSTGELLRKKLNTDYWINILKNEDWKSMQLSRGIMSALKLSYDQLPYHLQQCFSYCSIFPDSYKFLGEELVGFWIAQRFVKCNNSSQSLEGIGRCYLIDLVNLGFLQEVKREQSYLGTQILYAVRGIMHDFAVIVSRDDCASIDGRQFNKISQTLRHLSIVTGSAYNEDQHGNSHRDKKFEENLRNAVTSVSKLRTLVLLGPYDSFFLLLFQDIFMKAHNLRVLQMSATSADFLKRGYDEVDWALPQGLSKLYHLQVLDVGSYSGPTIPNGINNLVSLRHLIVHTGVYSSVATIDSMTSFQELHGVKFQISSGFEITQLQSTDESVEHWMHVKTLEEAYEAVLRNSELSEKLILSWKETSADIGMELERLEPRPDVKDLLVSGYNGDAWLSGPDSNISTSFQTVHINDCIEWKILPSLGRFPFLTKLKLRDLEEVKEILVPSLEELVLIQMPKLERCSCTSVEGMNSRLRALHIEDCQALKTFDLFKKDDKSEIRQRSWLPGLRKLILRDCPQLKVLKPLPPSTNVSEILISGVSTLPFMEGSGDGPLHIGPFDECSVESWVLDNKILAFHNLRSLKVLSIDGCKILLSFSLEGFSQLLSLKHFKILNCKKLFSSDVMPEHTLEDLTAANWKTFPSLESLKIKSCGIAEKWLCLLLRHAPYLEELDLEDISIEEGDSSSGDQDDALTRLDRDGLVHSSLKKIIIDTKSKDPSIFGCRKLFSSLVHKDASDDQANRRWLLPTSLEELDISYDYSGKTLQPCFPTDRTSLKILKVQHCEALESLQLRSCTALEELAIEICESLTVLEGLQSLQPCFPSDRASLKILKVQRCAALESLQLHSCTALEELVIGNCGSLTALEGLQSLGSLRHLNVYSCPGLPPYLETFSRQGYELCSRLETLEISDPSVLTTSVCNSLSSLRRLKLQWLVLTEEQGRALLLLRSLQQLEFYYCSNLVDLPAGLHLLPSLKWLKIRFCWRISRLPETGLPLSLEELEIVQCSKELTDQCRALATGKLRVKIYFFDVNSSSSAFIQ